MMLPKVSIIVCAFNAAQYISEALESIYKQSYKNYELIVINDGSTDETEKVIKKYHDQRLVYLQHQQNLGLIVSMRSGFKIARGEYISKIDADDIAMPELIEYQVKLLDASPEIGIVGTGFININACGEVLYISRRSSDNLFIQWDIMFGSPITHSGVMLRKKLLERFSLDYRKEFIHAEDYDLWSRLLNYCEGVNLPVALIKRRLHVQSVSNQFADIQKSHHLSIATRIIRGRNPRIEISTKDTQDLIILEEKRFFPLIKNIKELRKLVSIYLSLLSSFGQTNKNHPLFGYLVLKKLFVLYKKIMKTGRLSELSLSSYFYATKLFLKGIYYYSLYRISRLGKGLEWTLLFLL